MNGPTDRVEWPDPVRGGRRGRKSRLPWELRRRRCPRGGCLDRVRRESSAPTAGCDGLRSHTGRRGGRGGARGLPGWRRTEGRLWLGDRPVGCTRHRTRCTRGHVIRGQRDRGRRRGGHGRERRRRLWIRSRGRRHRRWSQGRQERLWVEIALGIRGQADAELDVRHRILRNAARPDDGNLLPFCDDVASSDESCTEVQQGHRVAVGHLDRHREAVRRDPPDERDRATDGSDDRVAEHTLDVDSSVLARRERSVLREQEAT